MLRYLPISSDRYSGEHVRRRRRFCIRHLCEAALYVLGSFPAHENVIYRFIPPSATRYECHHKDKHRQNGQRRKQIFFSEMGLTYSWIES